MATSSQSQGSDGLKDISFDGFVTTLKCHPTANVLATGLIGGEIYLHSLSKTGECEKKQKISFHRKSCRALKFSSDGRRLFSVSKDKTMCCVDAETGRLKRRIKGAHESPIYSLAICGDYFVATGDDDGIVKVWDIRTKKCAMEFNNCEEFISDLIMDERKFVIASSGEGTLTSFNLRRKRMEIQSELFEAELMCLARVKRGEKLLCGASDGVINVFNWGEWGNISHRFPCGTEQIDCIQPITEKVVCVGTTDGQIRAVSMFPSRILGYVGQHEEDFPIEAMSLTADGTYLATCSHDQAVKFWNIEAFKTKKIDTSKKGTRLARKKLANSSSAKVQMASFFSGLATGENSDDSDDGDDDNDDDDGDSDCSDKEDDSDVEDDSD